MEFPQLETKLYNIKNVPQHDAKDDKRIKNNSGKMQNKSAIISRSIQRDTNSLKISVLNEIGTNSKIAPTYQQLTNERTYGIPKLFSHLYNEPNSYGALCYSSIHSSVLSVGEEFSIRSIVGCNARCIAFLSTVKLVILDYTPSQHNELTRAVESNLMISIEYLKKLRMLAVSIVNAYKYVKFCLNKQLAQNTYSKTKEELCDLVDAYIIDQIDKSAEAISFTVQEKISDGDTILTFGCSSLVYHILEEARRRNVAFRLVLVDARPFNDAQELLRRFTAKGILCTCVAISAVGFIMNEVTKVILGSHALLANGYVMARTGTAQIALVGRSFNVPILVCCETHKFSQKVQTDSIVFNELGKSNEIIHSPQAKTASLTGWRSLEKLYPLNLLYDITPPELISAVVTEVSILPCSSVPVILRIRPTETMY